jgi:uncharacterized protein Yka (UPF0111/DUF47 family)
MSGSSNSVVSKLVNRVFPTMPDFYTLMNSQCDLLVQAMEAFVEYMEDGSDEKAIRVRELEKQGDELKSQNVDTLNRAFATPMDREDIYRAIVALDMVINYAKTSTREMEALQLAPDKYMLQIASEFHHGAQALQAGFRKLTSNPAQAEEDAAAARKAERNVEKIYRRALAELFDVSDMVTMLEAKTEGAEAKAMMAVVEMFKRREMYRHLSNGADRMAEAADRLHDIIVKIS